MLWSFIGNNQLLNYYLNPFLIFTFIFKKLHNIIKINFILSIKYRVLKNILNKTTLKPISPKKNHNINTNSILKTVKYVSIPFYKYNYNKLIYLILNKLLTLYQSNNNIYTLSIKNTPIKTNLSFFVFINLFYFKVRNY